VEDGNRLGVAILIKEGIRVIEETKFDEPICHGRVIAIKVLLKLEGKPRTLLIINIYAPLDTRAREKLLSTIKSKIKIEKEDLVLLAGDFNSIIRVQDHVGSQAREIDINVIKFIKEWKLEDAIDRMEVEEEDQFTCYREETKSKSRIDYMFTNFPVKVTMRIEVAPVETDHRLLTLTIENNATWERNIKFKIIRYPNLLNWS
jgi:endonuclease/exonuclease/phosphatase family metal-dependent hydrolase